MAVSARALRKVLISLELLLAHSLRAVRIALERAEVRRPIPRSRFSVSRKAVSIVNMLRTCLGI